LEGSGLHPVELPSWHLTEGDEKYEENLVTIAGVLFEIRMSGIQAYIRTVTLTGSVHCLILMIQSL
jgi:hypothetical protein